MSKWEEEYNELKAGKLDEKLKGLQELVDSKAATKEQYAEYKKYSKVKENMSQIAHILEYRDFQKNKIAKIDEILEKRTGFIKQEQEIAKQIEECAELEVSFIQLEAEMEALKAEKEKLAKELKGKDLSEEQRNEIMTKLLSVQEKVELNNKTYTERNKAIADKKENIKNSQEQLENDKKDIKQYENFGEEEINKLKMELSQKVSKCNMVAKNLLNARSWDYIDMKLDNWQDRRFTSKTKLSKVAEKVTEKSVVKKEEKVQPEMEEIEEIEEENKEQGLEKVSDFALKHPRLAKFFNKIKSIFVKEKPETVNEVVEEVKEEKTVEEKPVMDKDEEFKKFIKELAEKGMHQMETEKVKKSMEDAKAKFAENKKAAHQRETEKFGKDYADKSVNVDEIEKNEER